MEGANGENWDNCNNIINKIYKKTPAPKYVIIGTTEVNRGLQGSTEKQHIPQTGEGEP